MLYTKNKLSTFAGIRITKMDKTFIFGVSVTGDNFTDRVKETQRLKMNFGAGVNTILISPRRMGKTSRVKKVINETDRKDLKIIYMDIYDCRDEYDFYNRFASTVLKETSTKAEQIFDTAKDFLSRIVPKISVSPDQSSEYSVSLGITPKNSSPEEVLSLPEKIAVKKGIHIVVCIDEFQQIGEFSDTTTIQKRLRAVWQHQQNVSYCLFGSKQHLMEKLFQSKRMPFYQFGDTIYLERIPTDDWKKYITGRFAAKGKYISDSLAEEICSKVENYSSYVQQLAWNVFLNTDTEATEENLKDAIAELLAQNSALFMQQIGNLTTYQMNFIRALCSGISSGFGSKEVLETWNLGTKSNIARIQKVLIHNELVEKNGKTITLADPVFKLWFTTNYM